MLVLKCTETGRTIPVPSSITTVFGEDVQLVAVAAVDENSPPSLLQITSMEGTRVVRPSICGIRIEGVSEV